MIMTDENYVSERIEALRTAKNISARDMSLSLGQSTNYINNIENKRSLPSMSMFLYICEFLGISPKDFFDEENDNPDIVSGVVDVLKELDRESLELVLAIAERLKRS